MSNLLWRCYLEDNVDKFKSLLANGHHNSQHIPKGHGSGPAPSSSLGFNVGSPGTGFGTSPRNILKSRKSSGHASNTGGGKTQNNAFTRNELNCRDQSGLTILHRAASSTADNSLEFAIALIEHPNIDLYTQDRENGWTALHRAFYFGNITIARMLMERDSRDSVGQGASNTVLRSNALIKVKDFEGNSPFDVYNASIARRTREHRNRSAEEECENDEDDDSVAAGSSDDKTSTRYESIDGDEVFAFGSNKNLTLGFSDQDDRQHPEKVTLKRPAHLLYRFYREHLLSTASDPSLVDSLETISLKPVSDLPAIVKNRPIAVQDVCLSKLHSAILTTDPESNLFMCGFGPGGRLGTGDETTRFSYACIEGGGLAGKKITAIALGQNHSVAVSSDGEIFTWGTNRWGQLGYSLPRPATQNEEPFNNTPRQVFGPLKRESILGVAASAIHSVAFTSTSVYTWGKNEGQLGLMDSDSRSLEAQTIPRRVAASLFASPIQMVSAINRATICLLVNHTVCVFTNYGYNNVKFLVQGDFSNYHLSSNTLTTRYEADPSHISQITSGGDTIAAISSRGDLFTLTVSQRLDTSAAASTTNPSKIKSALSPPQRIWALRKGHWDGVKSVGVSENGSVIICTQAGAVWRRVRRTKVKNAFASGTGEFKCKDYKFQRVPGLTKVAAVRCNIFGGYAAIRKDCDVTKTQIFVQERTIWADMAPLFSLRGLEANTIFEDEESAPPRFWYPSLPKEHFDAFKRAVLMSPDLESDVARHVLNTTLDCGNYDFNICTSLSDTYIPVHGFVLAARSQMLREALSEYRKNGFYTSPETLSINSGNGKKFPTITCHGLDFITIVNLVLYAYTDEVVDVWHFPRHFPQSAFRFRGIRTELMKLAAKLNMAKLESAVRLMSEPERRLNFDITTAMGDPWFFEDGDAIVELDGGEMRIHSALLRQRCPFFEGLFNGRAAGQWLAMRREVSEDVKVDMKHIDPPTFELVLRYLYADVGTELFDEVVCADVDEFCDTVMDVLSVANELMLDRLSEICQQVLGRYINTRNACQLINAVAPCSVTEFKEAGLEYLCLQLEAMLENHLLGQLDEDLMLELDDVVRANQLACLPYAKSGKADHLLHERHPSLRAEIDEERQRLLRDMAFRSSIRDEDSRLSSSFRARVGSVDDMMSISPSQEKLQRRGKGSKNAPFSPSIRPKDSVVDLMFDMDDDDSTVIDNLTLHKQRSANASGSATPVVLKETWHDSKGRLLLGDENPPSISPNLTPVTPLFIRSELLSRKDNDTTQAAAKTWSSPVLPSSTSNFGMREIMAQASMNRTSVLSSSLSAQGIKENIVKPTTPKMSQKERRKQQQQQILQSTPNPHFTINKASPGDKPSSPWQLASTGPRTSLKDVLNADAKSLSVEQPSQLEKDSVAPLTLNRRRTASPDTRFPGQQRSSSLSTSKAQQVATLSITNGPSSFQMQSSKSTSIVPDSKNYKPTPAQAKPSLQLSMADIIGQQKREQDLVKEAVAKRSLQEIQEEQAFQEWWDQESRRAQEEEAARAASSTRGRGKSGKRGRGGSQRGGGDAGVRAGRRGRGGGENSVAE